MEKLVNTPNVQAAIAKVTGKGTSNKQGAGTPVTDAPLSNTPPVPNLKEHQCVTPIAKMPRHWVSTCSGQKAHESNGAYAPGSLLLGKGRNLIGSVALQGESVDLTLLKVSTSWVSGTQRAYTDSRFQELGFQTTDAWGDNYAVENFDFQFAMKRPESCDQEDLFPTKINDDNYLFVVSASMWNDEMDQKFWHPWFKDDRQDWPILETFSYNLVQEMGYKAMKYYLECDMEASASLSTSPEMLQFNADRGLQAPTALSKAA